MIDLGMPVERFMERHWQKRPLLVRQAVPSFAPELAPEDLAALACDPDVESRIVLRGDSTPEWEVRHGPFGETEFPGLPTRDWTLLVQEVDRWVPEVMRLLDRFRFVPNWRIDDVMVSYATPGGGVGPHVDQYDVFLLQAGGRREWHVGSEAVEEEDLVPDLELRILADFEAGESWVLDPGDMLYLPPRFAHDGVALDPGMTFSIGFRAPSHHEMLGMFLSHALESVEPRSRYEDPDLVPTDDPGEISPAAMRRVHDLLRDLVADDDRFEHWLGCFLTEPKRLREEPEEVDASAESIGGTLREGGELHRCTAPRFAYLRSAKGGVRLFVGGCEYEVPAGLEAPAVALCGTRPVRRDTLGPGATDPRFLGLLAELCNRGYLIEADEVG